MKYSACLPQMANLLHSIPPFPSPTSPHSPPHPCPTLGRFHECEQSNRPCLHYPNILPIHTMSSAHMSQNLTGSETIKAEKLTTSSGPFPFESSHLIHLSTVLYSTLRIQTCGSVVKKLVSVPRICFDVDMWMKLSLASRAETGRDDGRGDGGEGDGGRIL